jgi:hypothetical protein
MNHAFKQGYAFLFVCDQITVKKYYDNSFQLEKTDLFRENNLIK